MLATVVMRRLRYLVVVTPLVLLAVTLVPLLRTSVLAQQPAAPKDSVAKDSQPRLTSPGCEMCLGIAIAVINAALLAAPSSFLLTKEAFRQETRPLGFSDAHVSVFFAGGGSWEKPGKGWAHSENVEVLAGKLYGHLRIENFDFSDLGAVGFTTLRAGYVVHPRPPLAGGVTFGYRWARGDRVQDALEIGFPLFVGRERVWGRLEPVYLISAAGVTWNYRLQIEAPISRTPFLAGFNLEAKTVRQGGVYFITPAVVLGFRL